MKFKTETLDDGTVILQFQEVTEHGTIRESLSIPLSEQESMNLPVLLDTLIYRLMDKLEKVSPSADVNREAFRQRVKARTRSL